MLQDRLDDVGVVVDAELVRHGQQQRVGLGDSLVLGQLFDERVGLVSVATAEDRALLGLNVAEMILVLAAAEVGAVAVVDDGEDAAADRDARLSRVAGCGPGRTVGTDLLGLLDMEGLAALIELQCGALQVQAELGRPFGGGVGGGTPPNPVAQTLRVRLEAQQARRVREHGPRVRLGEALAAQDIKEDLRVTPGHVGVGLALGRHVAKMAPAVDHLLG